MTTQIPFNSRARFTDIWAIGVNGKSIPLPADLAMVVMPPTAATVTIVPPAGTSGVAFIVTPSAPGLFSVLLQSGTIKSNAQNLEALAPPLAQLNLGPPTIELST